MKAPHERVLARVQAEADGCWLWRGACNRAGYGTYTHRTSPGVSVTKKTHRIVYEGLIGPIPEGHDLDHLCFTPLCCNPAHLEPVTRSENVRRQRASGRAFDAGAMQRAKTHCSKGHEFTPENTRQTDKQRVCRACDRARGNWPQRNKEVVPGV